jgi:hypothetical protein
MMRTARTFAFALACVVAGGAPLGIANAAGAPGPNTDPAACVKPFFATSDGTANTAVVRVVDLGGPFTGTITAYGADRTWSATIERAAVIDLPYGGTEASVTVHADGPIAGIAYAPAWTTCTFRAGTRPRNYEAPDRQRPVLSLSNPQPIAPVSCATPYAAPAVKRAVEPNTPTGVFVRGTVNVAVALDEHGVPRFARVVASPVAEINASAVGAAKGSEYSPGTFRCEPVPSSYQFNVGYF